MVTARERQDDSSSHQGCCALRFRVGASYFSLAFQMLLRAALVIAVDLTLTLNWQRRQDTDEHCFTPGEAEAQGKMVIAPKSHSYLWVEKKTKQNQSPALWPHLFLLGCRAHGTWFPSVSPLYLVRRKSVNFEVGRVCIQIPAQPLGCDQQVSDLNCVHRYPETIIPTLQNSQKD